MLLGSYENSLTCISVWEGDKFIGLIRVVGDGHSIIFIQDPLVDPNYQRQGIGKQLMQKVLAKYPNVYQCHLVTDKTEKTINFYENLGFQKLEDWNCVTLTYTKNKQKTG